MWVVKGYTIGCYDTYLAYESGPYNNEKDAQEDADRLWCGEFSDFAIVEEIENNSLLNFLVMLM